MPIDLKSYAKEEIEKQIKRIHEDLESLSKLEKKTTRSVRGTAAGAMLHRKHHKSSLRTCGLILAGFRANGTRRVELRQRLPPNASAASSWKSGWWWP
jgi:hypothetical protein